MFCCATKSTLALASSSQPSYADPVAVLWLGRDTPDISAIPEHPEFSAKTPIAWSEANIYHVSSLKEFKNASLGLVFKATIDRLKTQPFAPRRFHAVVITDWTDTPKTAESLLAHLTATYAELSWMQAPHLIKGSAALLISEEIRSRFVPILVDVAPLTVEKKTPRMGAPAPLNLRVARVPLDAAGTRMPLDAAGTGATLHTAAGARVPLNLRRNREATAGAGIAHAPLDMRRTYDATVGENPLGTPFALTPFSSTPFSPSPFSSARHLPTSTNPSAVTSSPLVTDPITPSSRCAVLTLDKATLSTSNRSVSPSKLPLTPSTDPIQLLFERLLTLAVGPAEIASVRLHQHALLSAFDMKRLLGRGMSYISASNFRKAILYSDMGKLTYYKKWLTEPSENSTALLASLKLQDERPLTQLLARLTDRKPFINPAFTDEEIYQVFRAIPMLIAYFHEFQGMREAEVELLNGSISPQSFDETICGFYGHNGPGDPSFNIGGESPFWSILPKLGLSRLKTLVESGALPKKALTFFEGTSFIQEEGEFKYHDPQTALGYEHMVLDRFDGYRNSIKIREEIPFLRPIEAEIEVLFGPNYNTHIALVYDETVLLPKMLAKGMVNLEEAERLAKVTRQLRSRVHFIHAEFLKRIDKADELKALMQKGTPITQIAIHLPDEMTLHRPTDAASGSFYLFSKEEIGTWNSPSAQSFRDFVDTNVRYPVIQLDLEEHGIYDDFARHT